MHALYLSDRESGLGSALLSALKSLFSQRHLPDNPYYDLAAALGSYVDASPVWRVPDAALAAALDADAGAIEVVDPAARICAFAEAGGGPGCSGLPHVLRAASREAAGALRRVLLDQLPDSFFPGPAPFAVAAAEGRRGTTVQVLASVQVRGGASSIDRCQKDVRCSRQ